MGTPRDYQVGTQALSAVIVAAIKANVPGFLMGQVNEHQALINQIEAQGTKAVIDAVDADRAKVDAAKGQA
jgi:hypothetical protein